MFLRGNDTDFDYSLVDNNEVYDDRNIEEREAEESWFETEEPEWVTDIGSPSSLNHKLEGQTGVQDF